MMLHRPALLALTSLALLVTSACNRAGSPRDDATGLNAEEAVNAAMNANGAPPAPNLSGMLVPPAPGEPGGLPDDRAPLDESAAAIPTSVAAAGATVERWGDALANGRYGDAYRLWREDGKQSGMSEAQFAEAYRRYADIRVLVGRPQVGGTQTARIPVQLYGRVRATGEPFNLYGMMTLARNPNGQNGEPGQVPWLIAASELKPAGVVKVEPQSSAEEAAPSSFSAIPPSKAQVSSGSRAPSRTRSRLSPG